MNVGDSCHLPDLALGYSWDSISGSCPWKEGGQEGGRQLDQGLQPPYKVLVPFWPPGLSCLPSWGGGSFRAGAGA